MSLETSLEHIADQHAALSYPALTDLSDLSPSDVGRFAGTWARISAARKCEVIQGLVEMAEDNAELEFSAIFKVGLKDPDWGVRERSISGLWEYEDRSLIGTLVALLASDKSGEVRAAAAVALGRFAALAQDGRLLQKDSDAVRSALMAALTDVEGWLEVRRRALESIAAFRVVDVNEYIRWAYDSDDLKLKCSSIYAMGKTGEPAWLELLVRELQNPNPPVRYEAANACGEIDDEEAAPHLIALLHDDDTQVQLAAVGALGEIGGSLAKKALVRCVKREDPVLEDAARTALENIKTMEDPLGFAYES
ncbi:MAG: HEAT repeat domain-containing protein [Dehalococcoidia bacterium]|nr:HEAT repeat domain-containing protein [Dehalococcoidia bacterium]